MRLRAGAGGGVELRWRGPSDGSRWSGVELTLSCRALAKKMWEWSGVGLTLS
jgi:hypothetical protein